MKSLEAKALELSIAAERADQAYLAAAESVDGTVEATEAARVAAAAAEKKADAVWAAIVANKRGK